jgi:hypothetical protein
VKRIKKKEIILAHGHKNILATHKTTIEITKDKELSKKGNCIIAVGANKAISELSEDFKNKLRSKNSKLTIQIEVNGLNDELTAKGFHRLILTNTRDVVIRKSSYICDRTLAIKSNKAASELSRELVMKLRNPKHPVKIILTIN